MREPFAESVAANVNLLERNYLAARRWRRLIGEKEREVLLWDARPESGKMQNGFERGTTGLRSLEGCQG
jgi:hypothetical protein